MQEIRSNCFGSKKRSATLLQVKTGKHECRNVTATYTFRYIRYFQRILSFTQLYGVITESVVQLFLKTPVYGASLSYSMKIVSNQLKCAFTIY